jgi:hypothetical protein
MDAISKLSRDILFSVRPRRLMISPENSADNKVPDFRAEGDTDSDDDVNKRSIDDIDKPDKDQISEEQQKRSMPSRVETQKSSGKNICCIASCVRRAASGTAIAATGWPASLAVG